MLDAFHTRPASDPEKHQRAHVAVVDALRHDDDPHVMVAMPAPDDHDDAASRAIDSS